MVISIINSWDTEKAMLIYAEELSKGLPEGRLEKVLKYYDSPSKKQELKAFNSAIIMTYSYINREIQNSTAIATKKYIEEVKGIIDRQFK